MAMMMGGMPMMRCGRMGGDMRGDSRGDFGASRGHPRGVGLDACMGGSAPDQKKDPQAVKAYVDLDVRKRNLSSPLARRAGMPPVLLPRSLPLTTALLHIEEPKERGRQGTDSDGSRGLCAMKCVPSLRSTGGREERLSGKIQLHPGGLAGRTGGGANGGFES
jgi:hypothetical protein